MSEIFQIRQRKGEPIDITILRAFNAAIPRMSPQQGQAAAHWIIDKALDRKTPYRRTK